jgi:hypothetical protein
MGRGSEGVDPWIWESGANQIYIHFDQATETATEAFFTGADGARFTRNPL